MAYDEALAERIRELTAAEEGLTEKKMFGGVAFLVNGNMAVAASGQGGLLVRVDPGEGARLVETTDAVLRWPEAAARYRNEWLPHADWVVLDGVGPCPQLDAPLETAQLIAGFP